MFPSRLGDRWVINVIMVTQYPKDDSLFVITYGG